MSEQLCECGHPFSEHKELSRITLPKSYRGPFWVCGEAGPDACLCGKWRPAPAPPKLQVIDGGKS